ncbi:Tetraspanin-like protein [Euroglyphus maynei]|uniref:Tetraspanin n=1 Tax=Euroglyphus maynei TaxID=6958 RepID=A0A1Y3BQV7_EURMA|nr:Tetraspanin-like protein [Euroglyphus maynei]
MSVQPNRMGKLAGSCLLGIGIWLYVSYNTYARILPSYHLLSADNLALFIGAITFLVAFCGCCGSWFQSKCLLVVYLSSIIFIMIVEILVGLICFIFQSQLSQTLQSELLSGIQERYSFNDTNGIQSTWDHIQSNFHCCGVNNYTDWYQINAWPDKLRVPNSCCRPINDSSTIIDDDCGYDAESDLKHIWKFGCLQKIHHYLLTNIHGVGITSIIFAFIQFMALVCAFLVVFTMGYKKDKRKQRYITATNRSAYNRIRM